MLCVLPELTFNDHQTINVLIYIISLFIFFLHYSFQLDLLAVKQLIKTLQLHLDNSYLLLKLHVSLIIGVFLIAYITAMIYELKKEIN